MRKRAASGPCRTGAGQVIGFAKRLGHDAEVVIEATGNTLAVVKLMAPHVKRVVIANPLQVRAIAHAKGGRAEKKHCHSKPCDARQF